MNFTGDFWYGTSGTPQVENTGGKMKGFWIIFVEHTDGGQHHRHETLESAEAEARRLARLPENRGKRVYLFEAIGVCRAEEAPVNWNYFS